jgi:hypothetical protein
MKRNNKKNNKKLIFIDIKFDDTEFNKKGQVKKLKGKNFKKVLNLLVQKISNNKPDKNGYVDINCKKFTDEFSSYTDYLDYLRINGLIQRNRYEVNVKPFGYRFTEIFKKNIEIDNIIIPIEYFKTKNKYTCDGTRTIISDKVYNRLRKDFRSCKIILDFQLHPIRKTKDEWGNYINIGEWIKNNVKLHKFKHRLLYFHFKNYRIYNNFTQLSSYVRIENIELNEEKLVEFDIANSFPLMLARYALDKNPFLINDYDFQNYCTQVLNKSFYTKLQQGLNEIRNCSKKGFENDLDTRLLSRSETKTLFQAYLNGNYRKKGYVNGIQIEIQEYMRMKFPCVHEILKSLKDDNIKVYNELVLMETHLIMNIITDLYSKYNDLKLLTCHDAIYCPFSYKNKVREVWDYHFDKFIKPLPRETEEISESIKDLISWEF